MVLVHRKAGGRDEHGDPLPGEVSHSLMARAISPRRASGMLLAEEETDRGEYVIVGLIAYFAFGVDVRSTDIIEITEGPFAGMYDVVGEPGYWVNSISGRRSGTEVALSRHG